jgi:hypothetical protein
MIETTKLLESVEACVTWWTAAGSFAYKVDAQHYAASIYGDNQGVMVKHIDGHHYVVIAWKRKETLSNGRI